MTLPNPVRPLVEFPACLRAHGFAVSPDQTIGFLEAVALLGPRNMGDVKRSALSLFAVPPDRFEAFDLLYREFFYGEIIDREQVADSEERDDAEAREDIGLEAVETTEGEASETGMEAAAEERLGRRSIAPYGEDDALSRFARLAPEILPKRRTRRFAPARSGAALDLRKAFREAARRDGEFLVLPRRERRWRQRRILLLIDVSGSMKECSESLLRFAHALSGSAERFEAFTLGTRLTRITRPLSNRNRELAMFRVAELVADFDGGTRIGDSLQAFLSVPRFASFARGALVALISDGLERGEPDAMVDSVRTLARSAWKLIWLTPLYGDSEFRPETRALTLSLPNLDGLYDGSSATAAIACFRNLRRTA